MRVISDRDLVESPSASVPPITPRAVEASSQLALPRSPRSPATLEVPPMTEAMEDTDLVPVLRSFVTKCMQQLGQMVKEEAIEGGEEYEAEEEAEEDLLYIRAVVIDDNSSSSTQAQKGSLNDTHSEVDSDVEINILPASGRARRLSRRVVDKLRGVKKSRSTNKNGDDEGSVPVIWPKAILTSWLPGRSPSSRSRGAGDTGDAGADTDGSGWDSGYESGYAGVVVDGGGTDAVTPSCRLSIRLSRRSHNYDSANYSSKYHDNIASADGSITPSAVTTATTKAAAKPHFYRTNTRPDYLHRPEDVVSYPVSCDLNPEAPVFPNIGFDSRDDNENDGGDEQEQSSPRLSAPGLQAFTIEVADDTAVLAAALASSASAAGATPEDASGVTPQTILQTVSRTVPQSSQAPQAARTSSNDPPPLPVQSHLRVSHRPVGTPASINALSASISAEPATCRLRLLSPPPRRDRTPNRQYYPTSRSYTNRRAFEEFGPRDSLGVVPYSDGQLYRETDDDERPTAPWYEPSMGPYVDRVNITFTMLAFETTYSTSYAILDDDEDGPVHSRTDHHGRHPRRRPSWDTLEGRHTWSLSSNVQYEHIVLPDERIVSEVLAREVTDRIASDYEHDPEREDCRSGSAYSFDELDQRITSLDSDASYRPHRRHASLESTSSQDSTPSYETCSTCSALVPSHRYKGWNRPPIPPPYDDGRSERHDSYSRHHDRHSRV